MRINRVPLSSPFFLSLSFSPSFFWGCVCVCMRGGAIHFLHQDFGSSVFAAPGKCSKSGNASFAAVPAPEHINILEKFMYVRVCADMQPPTISSCVCVCADRRRDAVFVRGRGDTKKQTKSSLGVIAPNIQASLLEKQLLVSERLKPEMLKPRHRPAVLTNRGATLHFPSWSI